jgi:hypothetical protein
LALLLLLLLTLGRWDGYAGNLNEAELMKLAPQWAKLMGPSGYDTVTIDEFWYPNDGMSASSLDAHGRAVVDESKWPSAKGGNGFKTVAKSVHALGLKLGIHVMHGVPKAAVGNDTYTVLGMPSAKVSDLSDGTFCGWNKGWGRVDMSKPGAQEYFDSIYAQYAEWGVDFIKNDCVFGQNMNLTGTFTNIEAARKAMDKTGHTFVYSLSPGFRADVNGPGTDKPGAGMNGPKNALKVTSPLVNMYRMTSDWHGWHGADGKPGWPNHFELAGTYSSYIGAPGAHGLSWPDLDMLNPFEDHESMIMQQTLWAMARSPLIYGGKVEDITTSNPHIAIMTNPRVLAISDNSTKNHQVKRDATMAVWSAESTSPPAGKTALYVALFKLTGAPSPVSATFAELGVPAGAKVTAVDSWTGAAVALSGTSVSKSLSPCSTKSEGACCALMLLTF